MASLTHSLSHLLTLSTEYAGAGAERCQFTIQTLPATSQDGSSLEFAEATAGRECNIRDARAEGCAPLALIHIYLNS